MGWETSDRKDRLPEGWEAIIRPAVLRRCGYQCEARLPSGLRCPRRATDVDHRVPGNDHRPENLQGLCSHHHGKKSSKEGLEARRVVKAAKKRPQEGHPGDRRVR